MLHEVADVEARARLSVMLLEQVGGIQRAVVGVVQVCTIDFVVFRVAVGDAVYPANNRQGQEDAIRNAPWSIAHTTALDAVPVLSCWRGLMQHPVQALAISEHVVKPHCAAAARSS